MIDKQMKGLKSQNNVCTLKSSRYSSYQGLWLPLLHSERAREATWQDRKVTFFIMTAIPAPILIRAEA